MSNKEWYGTDSWYAPLEKEAGQEPAKKSHRRLKTGWKIAIGALLLLGLIIASSMLFSGSDQESSADFFPNEGLPDDWQSYFDSYYTQVEGTEAEINLEKAAAVPDFTLELKKAGDQELTLQELYEKCSKSIVAIMGYVDGEDGYYWGTGVILSRDGLILTNTHVIEGCDSATVTLFDDTSYEAKLVGADTTSDIAVLKIEARDLPVAVFGDSAELTVGEHVAAIGNPLGEEFRMTLTDGIISAIDRGINYNGHSQTLLQTNTALNEGNSGGALFNMYGQIIGITNMKMMSSYSSIEGIAFAIPSSTVRTVTDALIRFGEVRGRPAIGLTVAAIPQNAAEHYELPDGLYVSAVSEGSDAESKGIKTGDIITAVNGEPATKTQDILDVKNTLNVGDTITFTVWRDGESFDVDIVLVDNNDIY